MDQPVAMPEGRTVIGGRHGSPSVTIALPFSKITGADEELRDAIAELAELVARLADSGSADGSEHALIRDAAREVAGRVGRS